MMYEEQWDACQEYEWPLWNAAGNKDFTTVANSAFNNCVANHFHSNLLLGLRTYFYAQQ